MPLTFTRRFSIAVLFCFVILAPYGKDPRSADNESGLINFASEAKLPSFTLPDAKTKQQKTLNTSSGKPSIITFFSLSSPLRQKRSLALLDTQAKLNLEFGERINSVAIFSDPQDEDILRRFLEDGLITIQVLDDNEKQVYHKYGIYMMPITILLTSEGKLHAVIPFTGQREELLSTNIKYLLGDMTKDELQTSLEPKKNITRTKEEKEYIRRINYGRVMMARKMYPAAIREFSTAIKILPNSIEAIIGLGNTQLIAKQYAKAESDFRKALVINKDSDEALSGLGISLYRQGKIGEALPVLESALITDKPTLEVVVSLADIYEQKGEINKAMRLNKLAVSKLIQKFN